MEMLKGGTPIQMALKSQQKMEAEASRPEIQTVPVVMAEQVRSSVLMVAAWHCTKLVMALIIDAPYLSS